MDGLSFYFGVAVIVGTVYLVHVKRLKAQLDDSRSEVRGWLVTYNLIADSLQASNAELAVTRASLKRYTRKRNKQGRFSK